MTVGLAGKPARRLVDPWLLARVVVREFDPNPEPLRDPGPGAYQEVYDGFDTVYAQKRRPTGSQELGVHDVVELAHHFGTSYDATLYQLLNLRFLRRDDLEALLARKDAAESVARLLGILDWGEELRWSLTDRMLLLGFEAYRREEISRGKLVELAEKAGVTAEEVDVVLSESTEGRQPVEAIVPLE